MKGRKIPHTQVFHSWLKRIIQINSNETNGLRGRVYGFTRDCSSYFLHKKKSSRIITENKMGYEPLTKVPSRCLKPCLDEVEERNWVKSFSVSIIFWQKLWSPLPCLSTNIPKYHMWSVPVLGNRKWIDDTCQWKKMGELKVKCVQKWHKLFQKLRTDNEVTHLLTLCPYWNILNQVVCIIQGEKRLILNLSSI